MQDYMGEDLKIGDMVVFAGGSRRAGLHGPYVVHSFTEKRVRLAPWRGANATTIADPRECVKTFSQEGPHE